jgi:hypothetical protein
MAATINNMKRRTPHSSLSTTNRKLSKAAQLLDAAAAEIRDVDLEPSANIRKIGSALTTIFEIQHQIYRQQPSLQPAFLKKTVEGTGRRKTKTTNAPKKSPSGRLRTTNRSRS